MVVKSSIFFRPATGNDDSMRVAAQVVYDSFGTTASAGDASKFDPGVNDRGDG
jgi:hypothetical protein